MSVPDRDATLDAFVADADATREPDEPDETTETTGTDQRTKTDAVDAGEADRSPLVTTYAWSPAGGTCPSCGQSTTRWWRTDAGLVCPACVGWERTPNDP